jgi:hypothetical protein
MPRLNEIKEQLEFNFKNVDPVCRAHGCMQNQHFKTIRELQAIIGKLEEKLRAYEQG